MSVDPERIRKVKANIDMLVNTPQVNDWWWIDAIQMGMPVFAKFGKLPENRNTSTKCGICTNIPAISTVKTVCSIRKKVCGGEIRTLILPIKNLMVRIAIGVVVMDGYMQHWYVYWMKFLLMKNIAPDYINDFLTMSKAMKNANVKMVFGM